MNLDICCGPSTWSTHFLFILGLRSIDCKIGFLFPKVWLVDDFHGLLEVYGLGSWYVCKEAPGSKHALLLVEK